MATPGPPPTIKAGISASLSGQFQTQGRQALAGLQAWVDDVNQAGGIRVGPRQRRLELVHLDDGSLAAGAAEATRRLLDEHGVDLIFGPYSSGLARAAAEVTANRHQVLWNQGGAYAMNRPERRVVNILTEARHYLFTLPRLVRSADSSASSFAIVRCSAGAFSRSVSEGLGAEARRRGFSQVMCQEFPPCQSDFSPLADAVIRANPDLLLVVGRIRHDIAIAQTLVKRWKRKPSSRFAATAVVAAGIARFGAELGADAEGFIAPSQWEPPAPEISGQLPDPYFGPTPAQVMKSLSRAGKAAGGLPVDYPMAQAYATGLVAERCVLEVGSLDPAELWQAAGVLDFHTFFGKFKIHPSLGWQAGHSMPLVQWQQGRKAVIWPPAQQSGHIILY